MNPYNLKHRSRCCQEIKLEKSIFLLKHGINSDFYMKNYNIKNLSFNDSMNQDNSLEK